MSRCGTSDSTPRQPGTMIVSAFSSSTSPGVGTMVMPPAAVIGPSSTGKVANSYQLTPNSGLFSAKTSTVQPNSKVHSWL